MPTALPMALGVAMAASILSPLAGPSTAHAAQVQASGTCARTLETDAREPAKAVDILTVEATYDCELEQWQFSVDFASDLDKASAEAVAVEFDTDRNPATGCDGSDYTVVWFLEERDYSPVAQTSRCGFSFSPGGEGYGLATTDHEGGLRVSLGSAAGSAGAVDYRVSALAKDGSEDLAPDGGGNYTVDRTVPLPPRPVARARDNGSACPAGAVPEDGFVDVPANGVHESAIDCVVHWQVARGVGGGRYAPSEVVTRAQMASFVARMVVQAGGSLPQATRDHFNDDTALVHEDNINRLAEAGIIASSPDGRHFPAGPMSRALMAVYITRAYDHIARGAGKDVLRVAGDYFPDDDHSLESSINKAAAAGFTTGHTDGTYRPEAAVPRDQMASFLTRVLDLAVETGASKAP